MDYVKRKASIIVPIYNAQDYLEESLGDLLNQSYSDYEIICVDDGSTDGSREVITKLQKKDNRILLISQENSGGGAARNKGYDRAVGEFVLFLDADDRFESDLLEKAIGSLEGAKSDVLVYGADEFHYKTKENKPAPWLLQSGYEKYDGNPFHYTTTTVWNKLYRHDYLEKNNIRHQDERVTAFSMYFTFFSLFCTDRISFLDETLVHYRSENPKSSMRRHDSSPLDTIKVLEAIWMRVQNDDTLLRRRSIYINFAIKNIFERTGWFNTYEGFSIVYEYLHKGGFSRIGLTEEADNCIENENWKKLKNEIINYELAEYLFKREKKYKERGVLTKTVYLLPDVIKYKLSFEKCRVVLYGAGMVGRSYLPQIEKIENAQIVLWVDEKQGDRSLAVSEPSAITVIDFDYVVIGVEHRRFLSEIEEKLKDYGVLTEKILWEVPEKQL